MKLHELKSTEGSRHTRKRVGRGTATGQGETAGRGEHGQKSRSGFKNRLWFEGGQNPLYRRLPKRGFSNAKFKTIHATINVSDLNKFNDGDVITPALLIETGIVSKELDGIKVLGNGILDKKVTVKGCTFSKSAVKQIEDKGGKVEVA